MIRVNGFPLPSPDKLVIRFVPQNQTPAARALLRLEADWLVITNGQLREMLRLTAGQGTLTLIDPALGVERSMPVSLVLAETEQTRDGFGQTRLIVQEVVVG